MKILQTTDLKKYYGTEPNITRALDGVNFSVEEGEFVAVVGTSGSGKSTLLHMMGGLDTPTSGSVMVRDKELAKMNDEQLTIFRRRNIGFIFQSYNLLQSYSALENVAMPLMFRGIPKGLRNRRAKMILKQVGLDKRMSHKPAQMSGGQQQRVGIARAFVSKPKIVFADEPTGALNRTSSNEGMDELVKLNNKGTTIVMVTHDAKVAAKCGRVLFIVDGNIKGEYTGLKEITDEKERERSLNNWLLDLGW